MTSLRLVTLTAIALLGTCATAGASSIGISTPLLTRSQVIQYTADPGERNQVTVSTKSLGRTVIYDAGAKIRRDGSLGQGLCTVSGHRATCVTRTTPQVFMTLGDKDDAVAIGNFSYYVNVDGGDGDDVASSGPVGYVYLVGGPGNDTVHAQGAWGGGLVGGPGDDVLTAGAGARGNMYAGPGADSTLGAGEFFWDYSAYTADITVTPDGVANDGAAGEGDNVAPNTTNLYSGDGNDDLTAGVGGTFLLGHGGDDIIRGGPVRDGLFGGTGNDVIYAQGGGTDIIGCDDGTDQAFVDSLSELSYNNGYCETVVVGP